MTVKLPYTANDVGSLIVRVRGIDLFTGVDGKKLDQQLTTHTAVIVPVSGNGELINGAIRCSLRQNYVYICPARGTFGIQTEQGDDLSVYIIRYDFLQLEDDGDERYSVSDTWTPLLFSSEGELYMQAAGRAVALCRDIMEQLTSGDGLGRQRAQLNGAELVYMMLEAEREALKEQSFDALQRAKSHIDKRYSEDITIDRLAAIAGLSPKYFVDLFKKTYGVSAFDYLTQVRMNHAKQLMLRTELRMRNIAHKVGYEDEFYFSRKFKKTFGMSPSAYIKKRSRKIAAYGSAALTGYLLPLGIIPYAAPLHPKWTSYYCEQYGVDIAVHLDAYRNNLHKKGNLQQLIESKPDLIISDPELESWEREGLQLVTRLIELPEDRLGWRHKLVTLAEHMEAVEEAHIWLDSYDCKAREVRERVQQQFGKGRVLVLKLLKNQLYAHNCCSFDRLLYEELQLQRAYDDTASCYNHPLSLEQLNHIEADCVLLLICKETETLDYWKSLQQSVSWLSLSMIRDNKLRLVPSEPWREYSPIAMERMLDEADALFSGFRP